MLVALAAVAALVAPAAAFAHATLIGTTPATAPRCKPRPVW
jgi:hypothetical protein